MIFIRTGRRSWPGGHAVAVGIALFLASMLVFAASASAAARFRISPSAELLFADPVEIAVEGLVPGSEVEISAERSLTPHWIGEWGIRLFRSSARFVADGDGRVDLAAAPVSGSYAGADPMGLFWSMRPSDDPAGAERYEEVRLSVTAGGGRLASALVKLRGWLPEVRVEEVPGFPGAVFARLPGTEGGPAIIVLGGSEGGAGVARAMAQMFASRGYAVVGLPYHSPPDQSGRREIEALPPSFADIPLDRLEQVRDWLAERPDVDATRIGLWGFSKGAEYALAAASHFRWTGPVVALLPTDVIWEGWGQGVLPGTRASFSLDGRPLPFVPYDFGRQGPGLRAFMDDGRRAHPDRVPAARIAVERFRGELLVAGAEQDMTWDSARMAQNIAERRAETELDTRLLIFPGVGHVLAGDPWLPKGNGAAAAAESAAQYQVWQETFTLFERTLRPGAGSGGASDTPGSPRPP